MEIKGSDIPITMHPFPLKHIQTHTCSMEIPIRSLARDRCRVRIGGDWVQVRGDCMLGASVFRKTRIRCRRHCRNKSDGALVSHRQRVIEAVCRAHVHPSRASLPANTRHWYDHARRLCDENATARTLIIFRAPSMGKGYYNNSY